MASTTGNPALRAARQSAGYKSQEELVDALTKLGGRLGLHQLRVSVRQVRRWESAQPPWPHADAQRVLTQLLGRNMAELGFTAPWEQDQQQPDRVRRSIVAGTLAAVGLAAVPTHSAAAQQPASLGLDYAAVTRAHRRMYWTVPPAQLHPAVTGHAQLGCALLPDTAGTCRQALAAALAESFLLAGRMEFFDVQKPEQAADTFVRALQAAGVADEPLLGAAILAHAAFIPGWAGHRAQVAERMVAARTYARRGAASAEMWAWLDAVEAECETRCGNTQMALHLIGHAEDVLAAGSEHATPEWLDWFSPVRLAAFKGNTQLKAGHIPQARTTLEGVLAGLRDDDGKQRTVILGDLAAVEAAARNPERACEYAVQTLDQLEQSWYATGMERVRDVRRDLAAWQHEQCVRDLDERLYGWANTVSALQR